MIITTNQVLHISLFRAFLLPVELRFYIPKYLQCGLTNETIRTLVDSHYTKRDKSIRRYKRDQKMVRLKYGPISYWDTSQVTNMSFLFSYNPRFNCDISNWDVSNVTKMNYMFYAAESFNQPLNKWNVSKVTRMNSMFYGAKEFNQPLDNWNVSMVQNMQGMFWYAEKFNQPIIGKWDVSNVVNVGEMFRGALSFNQCMHK